MWGQRFLGKLLDEVASIFLPDITGEECPVLKRPGSLGYQAHRTELRKMERSEVTDKTVIARNLK